MSAAIFSCNKENAADFNPTIVDAHTIVYSDTTVAESGGNIALTMDVSTSTDGEMFYAISSELIATPDAYQLISGSVDALKNGSFEIIGDNKVFNDTIAGSPKYYVYSLIRNINDEITPVVVDTVVVEDITGPILKAEYSNPPSGTETNTSPVIELFFNEDVILVPGSFNMQVHSVKLNEGDLPEVTKSVNVLIGDVTVFGNSVTVDLSEYQFDCGNILVLFSAEGSFADAAGNSSQEIGWYHNGEEFEYIDYLFTMKDYNYNEVMSTFLGVNTVFNFVGGTISGSSYQYDVKLKGCSESSVLLGGIFGYHSDLDFAFDFENGGITFETFETALYFDEEDGKFHVGDPEGAYQHRVYYRPTVDAGGNSGNYNISDKSFYVSYQVYIDLLGAAAEVVTNYTKVEGAAASTNSVVTETEYTEAIRSFIAGK